MDTRSLPSWSIVATCLESKRAVEQFVSHHLSLDVREIFLFFDNPTDSMAERLSEVPRLHVVKCDDIYWQRRSGGRPTDHRQRQCYNANYADRSLNSAEWLAHIDIDEYLYPRGARSIAGMLAEIPPDMEAARVLPAEHLFDAFPEAGSLKSDGLFKLKPQSRSKFAARLFGELAPLFPSGFVGHEVGKSFKRAAASKGRFNIHFIRSEGRNTPHLVVPQSECVLLHAFPNSYEDFRRKFERRITSERYLASLPEKARAPFLSYRAERDAHGDEGTKRFFSETCVVDDQTCDWMKEQDLILELDLQFDRKISEVVKPFERALPFVHTSQPSSSPIGDACRVFQIGMNRSGSKDICAELERSGFSYCHWDNGQLARSLRRAKARGEKPFPEYGNFQVLSDISTSGSALVYDGFLDAGYIFEHYPEAVYILNYRPVDDWIDSRTRFRKGKYLQEATRYYGLSSDKETKTLWCEQWRKHQASMRELARRNGMKLIEYPIYTAAPGGLATEIRSLLGEAIYV